MKTIRSRKFRKIGREVLETYEEHVRTHIPLLLIPKSEQTDHLTSIDQKRVTNNIQTSHGNHQRNDVPPHNTTRRVRRKTKGMQEKMLWTYSPPTTK